jgi:hypothetical protein
MNEIIGDKDNKRALYEALTRYNYFPNQRISVGEIPPSINTRQFTPEVVEALIALKDDNKGRPAGYDLVEYKATRYNNVPRILSLAHPMGYALLVKCIHDNWAELKSVTENVNSIIKPEFHHEEKRLVVMNYEDPIGKVIRSHSSSFAKRFRVHADIANCFNSIYSHAIAWAAVGITEAKKEKNNGNAWFNRLDTFQRKTKRNETQGVPIGSATSSIVVELILNCVDEKLRNKGYEFQRYIDDYTCNCTTDNEAQKFIQDLSNLLATYKLTLNLNKTYIEDLPAALEDEWVLELRGALPSRLSHAGENEPKLSSTEALTFLNRAIGINKKTPDGSVLKYAVSVILLHLDTGVPFDLLEPLLNLSWHYPVLLPLVDLLLQKGELKAELCQVKLNEIIKENAEKSRSDGMSWPLHTMLSHGVIADRTTAEKVIASGDCVAITLLLEMKVFNDLIVEYAKNIIKNGDDYDKDNCWLLLYQLYYKGQIKSPYDDGVFKCMKEYKVNFIPGDTKSTAEIKCDEIKQAITSEALRYMFPPIVPVNAVSEVQPSDDLPVF